MGVYGFGRGGDHLSGQSSPRGSPVQHGSPVHKKNNLQTKETHSHKDQGLMSLNSWARVLGLPSAPEISAERLAANAV